MVSQETKSDELMQRMVQSVPVDVQGVSVSSVVYLSVFSEAANTGGFWES